MKILIIPNYDKKDALACTSEVHSKLCSLGAEVTVLKSEKGFSRTFSDKDLELIAQCDIVVTVGGDGTTLRSAKAAAMYSKPVLGINAGRLGFMSGLERNELDSLSALTDGSYTIEERMMLDVTLIDAEKRAVRTMHALNDAVLSRGAMPKLLDLVVALNENTTINCRADGLIFSTPTGSTAYAFSAGGPIIDPQINCIQVTPICSHSLLSKPMILSKNSVIRAKSADSCDYEILLAVDGEEQMPVMKGGYVEIRRSDSYAKLIRIKDDCFYDVIKTKFKD